MISSGSSSYAYEDIPIATSAVAPKEDNKSEEAIKKYLNEQAEQLSKEVEVTEHRSRRWLVVPSLVLGLLGIWMIAIGIIITVLRSLNIISFYGVNNALGPFVIAAGILLVLGYVFAFWQIRVSNKQTRSALLDKIFELKKISTALELVSIAPEKTKSHFQELLVQALLQSVSGQKIFLPELKYSTDGEIGIIDADTSQASGVGTARNKINDRPRSSNQLSY